MWHSARVAWEFANVGGSTLASTVVLMMKPLQDPCCSDLCRLQMHTSMLDVVLLEGVGLSASAPACKPCPLVLRFCRMLLWAGAQLNVTGVKAAALLCSAVYEGDMQLLRRLLQAGARANAEDYDKRTALHVAASDGNIPAVGGGVLCTD